MKINRIRLSCQSRTEVLRDRTADFMLFFFRSPAVYNDGGKSWELEASTAIISAGGAAQSFSPINGGALRYDMVSFRASSADKQYISSMELMLNTPVRLGDDFVISSTLRSMKSHSAHRSKYLGEFMELCMRLIFISMSDAYNDTAPGSDERIPRYKELRSLRDSIYEDPMNQWSVEEICEDMGISRAYFHRIYQSAFGVTCLQDIIESRLICAADLLKNTDLSVSEIAEQCGYDSDSYFMRQFKQHKGCTPSEYRRRAAE